MSAPRRLSLRSTSMARSISSANLMLKVTTRIDESEDSAGSVWGA
jgi:hypothetical protein